MSDIIKVDPLIICPDFKLEMRLSVVSAVFATIGELNPLS